MSHILSYSPAYSTLFRQRVTTLPCQPPLSNYSPAKLTEHVAIDHPVGAAVVPSSQIGSRVVLWQQSRGFNSDRVKGSFLKDFTPSAPIKSLSYPTVGAAWNYFANKITSFYLVAGNIPLRNISPDGKPFVAVQYSSSFPFLSFSPPKTTEFGKPGLKYRVVLPLQFNTTGVVNTSSLINQGFSEVRPNVFEAELRNVPNLGEVSIQVYSSTSTMVREFTLSSDLFPANEPGFFVESEFSANPLVSQLQSHIQTYPHIGIRNAELSNNSCLSSGWLQSYFNYNQQFGYGGDSWIASNGVNNSHPIESVAPGTLIYWVAYYNGDESGKRVRHPNGSILAAPVNRKKRIRCAFRLPVEITPIADSGVILRRCNPTLGYKPGLS